MGGGMRGEGGGGHARAVEPQGLHKSHYGRLVQTAGTLAVPSSQDRPLGGGGSRDSHEWSTKRP